MTTSAEPPGADAEPPGSESRPSAPRTGSGAAEPGERRLLDRAPGERYVRPPRSDASERRAVDPLLVPVALILGSALAFTLLGGVLTATVGLLVLAAFGGWLTGRLVSPPRLAALVGVVAVLAGFLGIWLFGRLEGGVLDPVTYLIDVEGPLVVLLAFALGGGLAAASSS